jgi:3-oxoadipate enol-lactonase
VVLGEEDIPEITRIGEALEARIPGARVAMIPGADHVVNLRQPERFDAAVIPFLREASGFG